MNESDVFQKTCGWTIPLIAICQDDGGIDRRHAQPDENETGYGDCVSLQGQKDQQDPRDFRRGSRADEKSVPCFIGDQAGQDPAQAFVAVGEGPFAGQADDWIENGIVVQLHVVDVHEVVFAALVSAEI